MNQKGFAAIAVLVTISALAFIFLGVGALSMLAQKQHELQAARRQSQTPVVTIPTVSCADLNEQQCLVDSSRCKTAYSLAVACFIAPCPPPRFERCEEVVSGTQAPIDTSIWKTYRNEQYGFEVKYPAEWATHESSSLFSADQTFVWAATSPDYRFGELYPCRGPECAPSPYGVRVGQKLYLTIFTKAHAQTFSDLTHIMSFGKELVLPSFDYGVIQVGGEKAINYREPIHVDDPEDCSTACVSPDGIRVRLLSPRNPMQVIEILLSRSEFNRPTSQDFFNTILSTFKFTRPSGGGFIEPSSNL